MHCRFLEIPAYTADSRCLDSVPDGILLVTMATQTPISTVSSSSSSSRQGKKSHQLPFPELPRPESEKWAPIPGFSSSYEVSDLAFIRSTDFSPSFHSAYPARLIPPGTEDPTVNLRVGDLGTRRVRIAVAVLEAFVGPRPRGCRPCFRDGDRTNCVLSNVFWGNQLDQRIASAEYEESQQINQSNTATALAAGDQYADVPSTASRGPGDEDHQDEHSVGDGLDQ